MSTMDRRLAGLPAHPYSFEPRFYPPGQHPATHRMREEVRVLEEIREKIARAGLPLDNVDEALAYCRDHLAAFEEQESEVKQRTLLMLERRERD